MKTRAICRVAICVCSLFMFLTTQTSAIVFTNNTTITATNLVYEGSPISVNGCTLIIEGAHSFGAFTVTNHGAAISATNLQVTSLSVYSSVFQSGGAATLNISGNLLLQNMATVLVHSANTTGMVGSVWLGVGGTISAVHVSVDGNSKISADGEGYFVGKGPGTGTGSCGASHGGSGAIDGNNRPGPRYGSATQPTTPGSGGNDGRGGGAIRLVVSGTLILDGEITADGVGAYYGSGSGGSIWATVGTLSGAGKFTADGGQNSSWNDGGGGRIAVYCDNTSAFAGFTNSTAEGHSAQDGTVGFFDTSGRNLRIWHHYLFEPSTTSTWNNLTLYTNAVIELYGASKLAATGTLYLANNTTLTVHNESVTGRVGGAWLGQGSTIEAKDMTVVSNGRITADGEGYFVGQGPGTGSGSYGASHGGLGAIEGANHPGPRYGSATQPTTPGSGGNEGQGGGTIRLIVSGTLTLNGEITADGVGKYYGSGSGGSIWATVGTLSGAGKFTADGGQNNTWNDGGGGRIAVYCDNTSAFAGFTNSTAEGHSAQDGTVGFFDTSERNLRVWHHYLFEPSTTSTWNNLTLYTNAVIELYGASKLAATSTLYLASNATLTVHNESVTGQVGGVWIGQGATIEAKDMTVVPSGRITADGEGYFVGKGPGTGTGSCGASHGGSGAIDGNNRPGPRYGSATQPTTPGSGGNDGRGGGTIRLMVSGTLTLDGEITADGVGAYYGSGSGGSIWATVGTLSGAGKFTADGGQNNTWNDGGGGRIAVYCDNTSAFAGFTNSTAEGHNAQDGTVGFFDTSGRNLRIWHHYLFEPSTTSTWNNLTLYTNAVIELYGASKLAATGTLYLANNTTLTVHNESVTGRVGGAWIGQGATIEAKDMTVVPSGRITADGEGYFVSQGPGTGTGSCGASHGGLGAIEGNNRPGPRYGSAMQPTTPGSGGNEGQGGGAIRLIVSGTLTLNGEITADGVGGYYGSGAGGSIWATVGTLSGAGKFTADGGQNSSWNDGGGGRIAVYCDNTSAFTGFTTSTAEGHGAEDGTVCFFNTSGVDMVVHHHFIVEEGVTNSFRNVWLTNGAQAVLYGGSHLIVSNTLYLASNTVIQVLCRNVTNSVGGLWLGEGATIQTLSNLRLDYGSVITADGQGYRGRLGSQTRGMGPGGALYWYGASHGGRGGCGDGGWRIEGTYGSFREPSQAGSGGGSAGGHGGGAIRLIVPGAFTMNGRITANGLNDYYGCGAGGSIWLTCGTLTGSGKFQADGGSYDSRSGGGGRVTIYAASYAGFTGFTNSTVEGYGAEDGTVCFFDASGVDMAVHHHFIVEEGVTNSFRNVWLTNGAQAVLYGGSRLIVSNTLSLASNTAIQVLCRNITNSVGGLWLGEGATIQTLSNLQLDPGSVITADGQGYRGRLGSQTRGMGPGGALYWYGASHGGRGGCGDGGWRIEGTYGSFREPSQAGSGGGSAGGHGGGTIRLIVPGAFTMNGRITANGLNDYYGCGSGGSIWLTCGTLTGSGKFQADGGSYDSRSGGGGRVAVYAASYAGFTGFTNSTAEGYGAQDGTVGFYDVSGADATVYHHFVFDPATTSSWRNLTIVSNAVVEIYGATRLNATGLLYMAGNSTMIVHNASVTGQVAGLWLGQGGSVKASTMTVSRGARITADHEGYVPRQGPGYGSGNSGGSHGGAGSKGGSDTVGPTYGSAVLPSTPGSGGGDNNGVGGGAIHLIVPGRLTIDGVISADGVAAYYGGGAGGSIWIDAGELVGTGQVRACGGVQNSWSSAGGGRVAVYSWSNLAFAVTNILVSGINTGTVFISVSPQFAWTEPTEDLWHGTEALAWAGGGFDPDQTRVDLSASAQGAQYFISRGVECSGRVPWNTAAVPDSWYQIKASFYGSSGQWLGDCTRNVLVRNQVDWHTGTISSSQTWARGQIHFVEGTLSITGATLTIEAGAVIKFAKDARIVVGNSGVLSALGAEGRLIVMTAVSDDTVGGDANLDGEKSGPQPGDWQGIQLAGNGQFHENEFVELRYLRTTHGGALANDETWRGSTAHEVTNDVVVPSGRRLTIEAGAIVKFAELKRIEVQSGGTIDVNGTLARPVIFTSLKDDIFGGDLNGDGDATWPEAGDWRGIHLSGGTGSLRHAILRYGGNSAGGTSWDSTSALLLVTPGAKLSVSNCLLRDALFEGVIAWGGGSVLLVNTIIDGADRGINPDGSSIIHVINCTLHDLRVGVWCHGGTIGLTNTMITHTREAGINRILSSPITVDHCNVWSPLGQTYVNMPSQTGTNGNISVDPLYRNPETGVFQLGYGSPAIDAANTPAAPATDAADAPRYDDPRTVNTGIGGTGGVFADMGAFEFVETAHSDIDLISTDVSGPADGLAGSTGVVSWTVRNIGAGSFSNEWRDVILLAPVNPGPWDTLIEATQVVSSAALGPNGYATFSARVRIPGATEGAWHWLVRANGRGDIFEGLNWNNNLSEPSAPMNLTVPTLTVGLPVATHYTGVGAADWYKLTQPTGQELSVVLDSAATNGRCRVYAGFGRLPTPELFDLRSLGWQSADAIMGLPSPNAARVVYLTVISEALASANLNYTISVNSTAFTIDSIGLSSAGNGGRATVPIQGRLLDSLTTALLKRSGQPDLPALANRLMDSTLLYATFDLRGVASGAYDVVLNKGGLERVLPAAFTVTAGGVGGRLSVEFLLPERVRLGRSFTGRIRYGNSGDGDLKSPLLTIQAPTSAQVWETGFTNGTLSTLDLLAAANTTPLPNVLSPGSFFTVPFQARLGSGGQNKFNVLAFYIDDPHTMDYVKLHEAIAPDNPGTAWTSAWQRIVATAGPTLGNYVDYLGETAVQAAQDGLELNTERQLLWYLLKEAGDVISHPAIAGTVRLANEPLAGQTVFLTEANNPTGAIYTTVSWVDGWFALDSVPAGAYDLSVDSYLPNPAMQVTLADPVNLPITNLDVLVTERAGSVSGWITQGDKGPGVAGIVLTAYGLVTPTNPVPTVHTAFSDTNGFYTITGLEAGNYELKLLAAGWAPMAPWTFTLAPRKELFQSFALSSRGGSITGQVQSAGGAPVPNATVILGTDSATDANLDWWGDFRITDSAGRYAFTSLPAGTYTLQATATNHGASAVQNVVLADATASIVCNIALTTPYSVTGQVIDADSKAGIPYASVAMDGRNSTSAGSGQFVISNVSAGVQTLSAWATNYGTASVTIQVPTNSPTRISLSPNGSVSGYLSRGTNRLANVLVTLYSERGPSQQTKTDTSGYYVFSGLSTGRHVLVVSGGAGAAMGRREFTPSGTQRNFQFDIGFSFATIAGHTLQSNAITPMTNVFVALISQSNVVATTRSDETGQYEFKVSQPGAFQLLAVGNTALFAPLSVNVTSNTALTNLNFIAPTGVLTCRVASASDSAVSNAEVRIQHNGDSSGAVLTWVGLTDSAGKCVFSGIVTGAYTVAVLADTYAYAERVIQVTGSSMANVELTAGRVVAGQVTSDGIGIGNAIVTVGPMGAGRAVALTDANGYYRISTLSTGVYEAVVIPPRSYQPAVRTNISTLAMQEQALNFELVGATSNLISGTIFDGLSNRVPEATVWLETPTGSGLGLSTVADRDGFYHLSNWPTGSYRIVAQASGYCKGSRSVVVTAMVDVVGQDVNLSMPMASEEMFLTPSTDANGMPAFMAMQSASPPTFAEGIRGAIANLIPDWIKDVWSGSLGLQPPEYWKNQLVLEGPQMDYWSWYMAQPEAVRLYCYKVDAALKQCQAQNDQVWDAYDHFLKSYPAIKELNSANVNLVLAQNAAIAAKAVKLAMSIKAIGYNPDTGGMEIPEWCVSPKDLKLIGDTVGQLEGFGEMFLQWARGEDVDIGFVLTGIGSILPTIDLIRERYGKNTLPPWLGPLVDAAALAKDCYDLAQSYQEMENSAVSGAILYLNCVGRLDNARIELHKAFARMKAEATQCLKDIGMAPEQPKPPQTTGGGGSTPAEGGPGGAGGGPAGSGTMDGVGSSDPNDKLTIGFGPEGFVGPQATLYYTIRFENKTNATAAAQRVTVTDRLTTNLDWSTFQLGDIGFNRTVVDIPEGLAEYAKSDLRVATDTYPVRTQAKLDPDSGVVQWIIETYDPATDDLPEDPLAGFLPPNTNAPSGEGYVTFRVCIPSNALDGMIFTNTASIVFDYNEAITTPSASNRLDNLPPQSHVLTLPSTSDAPFSVTWSGSDGGGSGVMSYDVYVSEEGGPWTLWLSAVTNTSAVFPAKPSIQYRFYSVARDHVGHVESSPGTPDATTQVAFWILDILPQASRPGDFVLHYQSASGHTYAVYTSTNFMKGFPQLLTNQVAVSSSSAWTGSFPNVNQAFFRVKKGP